MTAAALVSAKTDEHHTPDEWLERGREVLGGFDLDPASCAKANKRVRAGRYFTRRDDGLVKPWTGRRVWLNFPGDPAGRNLPRFWIRAVAHAHAGGVVLWAGFSTSQVPRLENLCGLIEGARRRTGRADKALSGFARQWMRGREPLGPSAYPLVYPAQRIAWISGATGKPQGQPPHANWWALLGGDEGERARFRDVFGATGAYVPPQGRPRQERDLATEVRKALLALGPLPMSRLAAAVGARKASVMNVVDAGIADGWCSRGSGTVNLTD